MTRRARHYDDVERRPTLDGLPLFAPYAKGSRTSKAAAEQVASDLQRRCTLVYAAICVAGEAGLAGFEIARNTGLSVLSVRPRLTQLLQDGSIEMTPEVRLNANGFGEMVVRQAK